MREKGKSINTLAYAGPSAMGFLNDPTKIEWRIHFKSPPEAVYRMLATDEGRARFWAESAVERDGEIEFHFPNGMHTNGKVLDKHRPHRFVIEYFGREVAFELKDDGRGGTDLHLITSSSAQDDRAEEIPGWVSVLMAMKAAVDFGLDLRNHDSTRTWDQGYADN